MTEWPIDKEISVHNLMNAPIQTKQDEIDFLRDALDHIARTARSSHTSTKRTAWIEERATLALQGKVPDVPAHLRPRVMSDETLFAKVKDATRYRKLRSRDRYPESLDFQIVDLQGYYEADMDALVDALPVLPAPEKDED